MRPLFAFLLLTMTITFFGCRKSDNEMERDLVGSWTRIQCQSSSDNGFNLYWFYGEITFHDNNLLREGGDNYCKDSCYIGPLGVIEGDFCICQWNVENGHLLVSPQGDSIRGHFVDTDFPYNTEIPIVKVSTNRLILDEWEKNGIRIERTCFKRK